MLGRRKLEDLSFDNTYARLPESFFAKLNPTPFSTAPSLISFNPAAAALIDLDPEEAKRPEFAGVFGGSLLVPGMEPLAMLYSGHHSAPMSRSSGMAVRSSWGKCVTHGAKNGTCNSRARG